MNALQRIIFPFGASLALLSIVLLAPAVTIAEEHGNPPPDKSTSGPDAHTPNSSPLQTGSIAPDFVTQNLEGKPVRLSDFRGKVVVIDFWATWCQPCLKSLPHTQEVASRYRNQQVVVFAVCTGDRRASFEKWMSANQGKYPDLVFAFDPHERGTDAYEEQAAKRLYGIHSIPAQFVITGDGKIAATLFGYYPREARLDAALARAGISVEDALRKEGEEQIHQREHISARN